MKRKLKINSLWVFFQKKLCFYTTFENDEMMDSNNHSAIYKTQGITKATIFGKTRYAIREMKYAFWNINCLPLQSGRFVDHVLSSWQVENTIPEDKLYPLSHWVTHELSYLWLLWVHTGDPLSTSSSVALIGHVMAINLKNSYWNYQCW